MKGNKEKILMFFEANRGVWVSGEVLAKRFAISRNAIWKAVHALESEGYHFDRSLRAKGYCFLPDNDILSRPGVEAFSSEQIDLVVLDTVTSTNVLAKALAGKGLKHSIVIAGAQTEGRGRLGRSFYSPALTGLYMSFLFPATSEQAFITIRTVVATCKALEAFTKEPLSIKWVNDIFYRGKKVVGILCEETSDLESGEMHSIIAGIGINVHEATFPEELSSIAGSLGITNSRNEVAGAIIRAMEEVIYSWPRERVLSFYRKRMLLIGEEVEYKKNGVNTRGKVLGIADSGALEIMRAGVKEELFSGEVTIGSQVALGNK